MKKTCIIQQEAGIGDIIFCQTIAKKYIDLGYDVIWPVSPVVLEITKYFDSPIHYFDNTKDYMFKDKFLELYESKKLIETDDFCFLPLGYASHIVNKKTMHSKYNLCDIDVSTWRQGINLKRNKDKENYLFYDILKLDDNSDYFLVNQNWVTPPDYRKMPLHDLLSVIDISNNTLVEMQFLDNYNVFDWCKVIEKANKIVTVDTCIMYIIDIIETKSKLNYCKPRYSKNTVNEIHDLFEKKWMYYD